MGSNVLGELPVLITGDYSDLDDAIQQAAKNAQSGAQTISSSMNSGARSAGDMSDVFQALTSEGLEFDKTVKLDAASLLEFGNIGKQALQSLEQQGKELTDTLGETASKGKPAMQEVEAEAQKLTDSLRQASDNLQSVGAELSKAFTVPLAAIGAALIKVGMDFDEASDTIRAKTGQTGEALESLNGIVANLAGAVPNKLSDITTAVVTLQTRLQLSGDDLQRFSEQLLNLSRISGEAIGPLADNAARAFQRWGVATNDQAEALDKLYVASTKTGTGVNTMLGMLRQFAPALQEVGFSFDQATALIATFEQSGLNTQRDITALQQALLKLGKAGIKDPVEGLQLLIDRIQAAGSAGEANAIGMKVFGKGAVDLVSAIRDGKLNLDAFTASLKDSGGAVNTAASDTLSFGDKLHLLANNLEKELKPAAEAFLDIAEQMLDDLKPLIGVIGDMAKGFADLDPAMQKVIIGAGLIVGAIGPAVYALGGMLNIVNKLIPGLGSMSATEGLAGAEAAAAAEAGTLSTAIAGIAFATMAVGMAATISNLDDLRQKWDDTAEEFKRKQIVDAINSGVTLETLKKIGVSVDDVKASISGLAIETQSAGEKFDNFGIKVTVAGQAASGAAAAQGQHNAALQGGAQSAAQMNSALDALLTGEKSHVLTLADFLAKQKQLDAEATAARTVFDQVAKAYDAGKVSATTLAAAHDQLAKALKAAHGEAQGYLDFERQFEEQQRSLEDRARSLALAVNDLTEKYNNGEVYSTVLQRATDELEKALKAAGITLADLTSGTGDESVQVYTGHLKSAITQTDQLTSATGGASDALTRAKAALAGTDAVVPVLAGHIGQTKAVTDGLGSSAQAAGDTMQSAFEAVDSTVLSLDESLKQAGIDLMSFQSISQQISNQQGGAGRGGRWGGRDQGVIGNIDLNQNHIDWVSRISGGMIVKPIIDTSLDDATFLDEFASGRYYLDQAAWDHLSEIYARQRAGKGSAPAPSSPTSGMVPVPGAPGHYTTAPTDSGITVGLKNLGNAVSGMNTTVQDTTAAITDLGSTIDTVTQTTLPTLQQTVNQVAGSMTQAASQVTEAIAPIISGNASTSLSPLATSPATQAVNGAYAPGSVMTSNITNSQTSSPVTYNINVNSPTAQQTAQEIVTTIQRIGART